MSASWTPLHCIFAVTCAHKYGNVINVHVTVRHDGISISVATGCGINIGVAVRRDGISISVATRCGINIGVAVRRDGISISVATRCGIPFVSLR